MPHGDEQKEKKETAEDIIAQGEEVNLSEADLPF